ncbi:FxsA family protein [Mariprofundus sp. EBB-1]|uniref:FxsA family protein n=1 Tax=Mariprofundus sp. EBB-1 TaxID=2650971 RepID=UPI000EF232E9|nr:FxsA family protein [Mariprofundus sp. EBB-1]RLL50908.1 FxsA family protein [Mariprofundus sp. EBB-1]
MLRILFLLFISIPLLELWLLIEVGSGIGGLSTIALCLLTAALGGFLIRWQGMSTLIDAQKRMAHGEAPIEHGLHGLMIAFSGLLLFTPGFITDSMGFLLLFPPFRRLVIGMLPFQKINQTNPGNRSGSSDIIDAEVITHDKHIS